MFGRKPFSWRLLYCVTVTATFTVWISATTPTFPSEWPFGEDKPKVRLRVRGVAEYCFNLLQMVEVVAGEMFRYRCDAFDASFSVDSVLMPLPLVERL